MKKVLFSMSLLLALPAMAWAGPRSLSEMMAEAGKVIPVKSGARSAAGSMEVLKQAKQFTVIGYKQGGYAVIANDDKFAPVLGYTDSPLPDVIPPALQWWMDAMDASLTQRLSEGAPATRAAEYLPDGYAKSVDAVVASRWNQEAPYNLLTPTYVENGVQTHYYTGCVATSMAQVMNYHEWPDVGEGYSSYDFIPDNGDRMQTLSADYDMTHYDWANMLDIYSGTYSDAEANAVATLMSHCGISVEMQYDKDGSGAYSVKACQALKTYFKYNKNIRLFNRDFYPVKEWMQIVYRELNDRCPIIYGGVQQSNTGVHSAHSFVLDGYDENGLVHVNWGWGGSSDGYFDIAQLGGYAYSQDMVIVRMPDDARFTDTYHSCWGLQGSMVVTNMGTRLQISFPTRLPGANYGAIMINATDTPFTGSVAIVAINMADNTVTVLDEITSTSEAAYSAGFSIGTDGSLFADVSSLADGQYRVCFASKDVMESEWQPMRSNENYTNNYILNISSTGGLDITLEPGDSQWTASGIENVAAGSQDDGTVRVYNLSGSMVYSAPASGFSLDDVPATGVLIVKKGNEVTKVVK